MEQEFQKRLCDLADNTIRTNRQSSTPFLTPAESSEALKYLRMRHDITYIFSGGFDGAERVRLFFLPDYISEDSFPLNENITAIYAKCPFGNPSHRDWLGSLMGLGIKRETVGDILALGDEGYILCTPQIAGFICDNLTRIGRLGVKCREVPLSDIRVPEPVFDVVSGTVASLRADTVLSLAFGISRTKAAELIRDGKFSLDHIEELCISREISEGMLLSLRGFGRARLAGIGGISKKGRQFIELHVFSSK